MEGLDGATFFWLTALGLVTGGLTKVILGSRGISLVANLAAGVLATTVTSGLFLVMSLPGSMVVALLGSISILFVINVFYLQPEHAEH